LVFEGNFWDDVCKTASQKTTNIVDWLKDIDMVTTVQRLKPFTFQNKK
jgi:hypothetical protein